MRQLISKSSLEAGSGERPAVQVSQAVLDSVLRHYEQGEYLKAYAVAQQHGPLRDWVGTEARLLAGRLAANLGAPRLARALHYLAWRAEPTHPAALMYYLRAVHERFGLLAAWRLARRVGDLPEAPPSIRAEWLAHRAVLAARLRDFEAADALLRRTDQLDGGQPWLCIERCIVLELMDRYDEALAAANRSLQIQPWFRPGVEATAHLLGLLDRDGEALELLREADQRLESGLVTTQLAMLQRELELYPEFHRSLERCCELLPMREKHTEKWLAAARSDAAYYCGDYAAAATLARQADSPFHTQVAPRLEELAAGKAPEPSDLPERLLLKVGFVRQHHMTCGPATLAALSRYWNRPVTHLSLVEAICYDGTPPQKDRAWAEANGWVAREFTVTWTSAVELLRRGAPFVLTTVDPASGHLQAVIGYDSRRQTLLIRDPYERHYREFIADAFFERYRATGPRGMVLLPAEEAHRLDGLELPDEKLFDLFHEIHVALEKHDRPRAMAALEAMRQAAPTHRLVLWARRWIAVYDQDPAAQLESLERLLELYPDDGVLLLGKLACLRNLGRREQRLALLTSACGKAGADPVFWAQHAQELAADARQHRQAAHLLRRCIRFRPQEPGSHYVLANLLWSQRRFDEAIDLYRFASCLNDKDEQLAMSYFRAARQVRQTEPVLAMLRERFQRLGGRSSQPAQTLSAALAMLERTVEAFEVLDEAMRLRPEDGELLLYVADVCARHGRFDRAMELLDKARPRTRPAAHLRVQANLAAYRGELAESLALWRQVLDDEPLAVDAHQAVTQLLAETEGRPSAMAHLERVGERFPHFVPIHQLRVRWLRDEDPAQAERALRHVLECNPADGFAQRELALLLLAQNRPAEALAAAAESTRLDPEESYSHSVMARALAASGRLPEAQDEWRRAIRRSVDNEDAIEQLFQSLETLEQKRRELDVLRGELVRQVIGGEGLLAYRQHARSIIDSRELLAHLREALDARPDLWHAWVAVIRQLADDNDLPAARELAHQATERFALLPAMWMELAAICRLMGDDPAEADALKHVLEISPTWALAVRRLADMHARAGDLVRARQLLQQATAWTPLDAANHADLADLLWRLGEKSEALQRLEHALRLDPKLDWGWPTLADWSAQLDSPQTAIEVARDLTRRRGGEAHSWVMLAHMLAEQPSPREALEALDHAARVEPRSVPAADLRAWLLTRHGRFEEALAACHPPAYGGKPPLPLRGRAAWILSQQGRAQEALDQCRELVREDPTYAWGWQQIAELASGMNQNEEYLSAAEALRRLWPHDPEACWRVGQAHQALGNHTEAAEAYQRAIQLRPDFAPAAFALFDLQLEQGNTGHAAETLGQYKKLASGQYAQDYIDARQVRLAAKNDQYDQAMQAFDRLCASANPNPWPIDAAVEAMESLIYPSSLDQELLAAALRDPVNPHVGELWVRRLASARHWKQLEAGLERMCYHPDPPPGWFARRRGRGQAPAGAQRAVFRAAACAAVEALADVAEGIRVKRHVQRYERWLGPDKTWWGCVAHAWTTLHYHDHVIRWMADWKQREPEQWMLANLVIALRAKRRDAQAAEVSMHAAQLRRDGSWSIHAVWLAFDQAVKGSADEAQHLLADVNDGELNDHFRCLLRLSQAVLEARRLGASDPAGGFAAARNTLRTARVWSGGLPSKCLYRAYRRAARRIVAECPIWRARLWYWLRVVPVYHLMTSF